MTDVGAATATHASVSAAGIATFHISDSTLALRIVATESSIQSGAAAAGQAALFQFGADAYLFISDGTDGVTSADVLIKLVGVDTTAAAFDTLTDGGTTFTIA